MKINHKTSLEFRRDLRDLSFNDEDAQYENLFRFILDAYEDCEKELAKHIPEPRRCHICNKPEPKHSPSCPHGKQTP